MNDLLVIEFGRGAMVLSGFPVGQFLAQWWVFPASVLFAAVALGSGVSGALFFNLFFVLAVGLTPAQAIGAGLLTEVLGMGNGFRSYVLATSVFVLAIAATTGAAVHVIAATPVWYVVGWSIPGVLVGGTVGTRAGKPLPSDLMETALGGVFVFVGALVLAVEPRLGRGSLPP